MLHQVFGQGRARIRRFLKITLLLGLLLFVCQLGYIHYSHYSDKVQIPKDLHVQLGKMTGETQGRRSNVQLLLTTRSPKPSTDPPISRRDNKKKINVIRKMGPTGRRHRNASQVEKSDAAITLFKNLTSTRDLFRVLVGNPRQEKGRLTIGIPSMRRPNTNVVYLLYTLSSIVRATSDDEKARTSVVVLLTDKNVTYSSAISKAIYRDFPQYCDNGFINVIEISKDVYPDLNHVKKTFNDPQPRLKWRAKQNIDFAYLMYYCREMSKYYLQIEDDVIAASDFAKDIDKFIALQTIDWFVLEFSYLGFIGKLFKSSNLGWLAEFLLRNFDLAPGDLLLGVMRQIRHQNHTLMSNVTLFQHIGKYSSLRNKLMPSIDILFKDKAAVKFEVDDVPKGFYPPAEIETSLEVYTEYTPAKAYDGNMSTYFWGKTPKKGDNFTIKFNTTQNVSRILVFSGHPQTFVDRMLHSKLMVATVSSKTDKPRGQCGTFSKLVGLVDGQADTLGTGSRIPRDITCLRIQFTRPGDAWAILREIILVK